MYMNCFNANSVMTGMLYSPSNSVSCSSDKYIFSFHLESQTPCRRNYVDFVACYFHLVWLSISILIVHRIISSVAIYLLTKSKFDYWYNSQYSWFKTCLLLFSVGQLYVSVLSVSHMVVST